MKHILLIIAFFCLTFFVYSQSYFQQEVNFKINVRLDDSLHELFADEIIEYINNSPDTLHFIWFHIWPNAYSNNKTAFWKQVLQDEGQKKYFDYKKNPGYIDSLNFSVNHDEIKWEYHPEHVDICKLILNTPLLPGTAITISTPFHVKIPYGKYSRLGHIKQTYQITQWFPKPAVYDKNGWHEMPYLNRGEFYSEYGSFDVSITLPANYVVGATGNLQTYSEIQWLNKKAAQTRDSENYTYVKIPSSNEFKTIRYTENNIHDFAWFADKNFYVLKSEVSLPKSGRTVTTWAMFTAKYASQWDKATSYINDAIYYYSLWNGEYPYNNCTAVEGALSAGGGMEYPTITIIGATTGDRLLEEVIMHEVGHNWFYGIFGFNERDYPFLDEGINTFNQLRYINTKYNTPMFYEQYGIPKDVAEITHVEDFSYSGMYELAWLFSEREGYSQPINTSSEGFNMTNYGVIGYFKAAQAWNYLRHYLGNEEFDRISHLFYDKWKYKHPYPEDIREIFESNTDKELSWFFDDVLNSNKKIDYEIETQTDNLLLIKNKKNGISAPFQLAIFNNDGTKSIKWLNGFTGKRWIEVPTRNASFAIDPNNITLDINRLNNNYDSTREYINTPPIKFQFLGKYEETNKYQVFYAPVIGVNALNGLMLGAAFYNYTFPQKRFNFLVMPMYTTDNSHFAGIIKLRYNITDKLSAKLHLKQFGLTNKTQYLTDKDYKRLKAEINYRLQPELNNPKWTDYNISFVKFNNVSERPSLCQNLVFNTIKPISHFFNIDITHQNNRKLNPYSLHSRVELGKNLLKVSFETSFKFNYGYRKKDLDIRVFAGIMKIDNVYPSMGDLAVIQYYQSPYSFSLNGRSGSEDYQADNYFINRESGGNNSISSWTNQQFVANEGGFAIYAPGLYSNNAMLTLNLKTSIPKINIIKLYANVGIFKRKKYDTIYYLPDGTLASSYETYWFGAEEASKYPVYEAGVELRIIPEIISIYFPVLLSKDLKQYSDKMTDNYWQKIRFTLYLNKLDPQELIKKAF